MVGFGFAFFLDHEERLWKSGMCCKHGSARTIDRDGSVPCLPCNEAEIDSRGCSGSIVLRVVVACSDGS